MLVNAVKHRSGVDSSAAAARFDQLYQSRNALDRFDGAAVPPDIAALHCNGFLGPGDLSFYEGLLREHVSHLDGRTLLELGCGRAGLGRFLARRLGLRLVGVDLSPVALHQAREDALRECDATIDQLIEADFADTGLPARSMAAIISLDSIYFATEPRMALAEAARVAIPGAPFVFTACGETGNTSVNERWKEWLQETGFTVTRAEDISASWHDGLRQKHEHRCRNAALLKEHLGSSMAERVLAVSRSLLGLDEGPALLSTRWRYLYVAVRRQDDFDGDP